MANARPSMTRRGRSLSLPLSLPKANGPAGISINGLPGTGSSPAPALIDVTTTRAASGLEIDTVLALSVEEEHPLRRDTDAHHLIEIADEILVGAHGQQAVAHANADQRAVAGELHRIDRRGDAGVRAAAGKHPDILGPDAHHGAGDSGATEAADPEAAGTREDAVLHLPGEQVHRRRPDEPGNKEGARIVVDFPWRSQLLD